MRQSGAALNREHRIHRARHLWSGPCFCDARKQVLQVTIQKGEMPKVIDMVGYTSGRLTVTAMLHKRSRAGHVMFLALCECGNYTVVTGGNLRRSCATASCSCLHRERTSEAAKKNSRKHGMSGTSEHTAWTHMKYRCNTQTAACYPGYGGRGIKICRRWLGKNGFQNFYADLGPKPSPKHSLDRIDNDGNYEPSNCRWALPPVQAQNTRHTALTMEKAREIRRLYATGEFSQAVVGKRYSVSRALISCVTTNKIWKEQ